MNLFDISSFSAAFGSVAGGSNYNLLADFNCNGVVNVFDVFYLNITFGMMDDAPPTFDYSIKPFCNSLKPVYIFYVSVLLFILVLNKLLSSAKP